MHARLQTTQLGAQRKSGDWHHQGQVPGWCLQRCSFRAMFPDASALAIDLMERMLQFNPARRITVEDALAHPYLAQLHDPAAELSAPGEAATESESDCISSSHIRLIGCLAVIGQASCTSKQLVSCRRCQLVLLRKTHPEWRLGRHLCMHCIPRAAAASSPLGPPCLSSVGACQHP